MTTLHRCAGMLLLAACAHPVQTVVMLPPTAQARSFLGDTLWAVPLDPSEAPALVQSLQAARREALAQPHELDPRLRYASRTADLGRLREAIGLYSDILREFPTAHQAREQRAALLLLVRELDTAIDELQASGLNNLKEGTFFFHRWGFFHLGFAYYLRGDWDHARLTFEESLRQALVPDDELLSLFWLFLSIRRSGDEAAALAVLDSIPAGITATGRAAELNMLRAFKGEIRISQLPVDLLAPLTTVEDALYGYGVGVTLLLVGREEEATLLFQRVRQTPNWTAWPFIAAERELARLREPPS